MAEPEDEDQDLQIRRLASDDPAMTIPASGTISRSHSQPQRVRSRANAASTKASAAEEAETDSSVKSSAEVPLEDADADAPSKYDVGWRRVVRNFSPSWFSVTMGTGVVSLLLIAIPFRADWLYWLSVAFFGLNTLLFALAFLASLARYTFYPEIWAVMIADPTNSLFLGTVPMGFATLLESWVLLCCPYWGRWSVTFAWVLWMIDAVVSVAITVSLPFLLMSQTHQHSLDRITAAQLLPIAATIVASGAGAVVAEVLTDPQQILGTLIASYVMWGMAMPLALTILVIYYQRLALHKLPPREVVVSSFLPVGPLGMGGYAIMRLGKVARAVFPRVELFHDLPVAGDVVYVVGVFLALILWGFGLCWLAFALATIYSSRPFPFNMGWWGFTFPLGVYAISTMNFGAEFPSLFFNVLGTILGVAVICLWCVVAGGTIRGAWSGHLFAAPCLKNLKRDEGPEGGGGPEQAALQDREKTPATTT